MMNHNTLLVLGNGFDLDLGLKTSFKDFMQSSRYDLKLENSYMFRLIKDKNKWGDIEGVLRDAVLNSISNNDNSADKEINKTWQLLRNEWGEYLPQYIDDVQNLLKQVLLNEVDKKKTDSVPIKIDSCAYSLAKCVSDWGAVFSFNYTNPADFLFGIWPNDIHFIHNSFVPHKYSPYPMYQIANFLTIGIDSKRINEQLIDREYLSPIIKLNFVETSLLDELSQAMVDADNIIFFGHSMSITDSDYFEDFFKGMTDNSIIDKRLFFVTYNQKSLNDIKANMIGWDVNYDKLVQSKNEVISVFTNNGPENEDFKKMLDIV